jgi:hypothetical protein
MIKDDIVLGIVCRNEAAAGVAIAVGRVFIPSVCKALL